MGFLLLLRSNGLILAFAAVLLQIAVFLQPLLPVQYQVAPVCETITRALLTTDAHASMSEHSQHHAHAEHAQHDANHQCQYCTVYGHLVMLPDWDLKPVLDRIYVRFIAWQQSARHIWFVLQRLFLLPQGRAPPQFA